MLKIIVRRSSIWQLIFIYILLGASVGYLAWGDVYQEITVHEEFKRVTGWSLPDSAEIIFDKTELSGPLNTDFVSALEVSVSQSTAEKWLDDCPFDGKTVWFQSQVDELLDHTFWASYDLNIRNSESVFYAKIESQAGEYEEIVFLEPKQGLVCLLRSKW